MDHHDQHHDDMSSPRSYTDSQWSPPPPGFRELDQIYAADGSPHTYSNPNSPPAVSPPLPYEHEYHQHPQPQNYETYQQGYVAFALSTDSSQKTKPSLYLAS